MPVESPAAVPAAGSGLAAWLTPARVAALVACAGLAILHTWPLGLDPGGWSRVDSADYQLNAWAIAWVARTLPIDPIGLFDANIFYPAPRALAYSEPLIVPAALTMPVSWSGGSAVLAHNLALLAGLTLGAWAFACYTQRASPARGSPEWLPARWRPSTRTR